MARVEFYVSADVRLDELLAKRFEALYRSGITKTDITTRALRMFLDRDAADIVKDVGLVERLEQAEVIELDEREYKPLPEKVEVEEGGK